MEDVFVGEALNSMDARVLTDALEEIVDAAVAVEAFLASSSSAGEEGPHTFC